MADQLWLMTRIREEEEGHESASCKWRYSKCPDLYSTFITTIL